jgi:hypothetical protein
MGPDGRWDLEGARLPKSVLGPGYFGLGSVVGEGWVRGERVGFLYE